MLKRFFKWLYNLFFWSILLVDFEEYPVEDELIVLDNHYEYEDLSPKQERIYSHSETSVSWQPVHVFDSKKLTNGVRHVCFSVPREIDKSKNSKKKDKKFYRKAGSCKRIVEYFAE